MKKIFLLVLIIIVIASVAMAVFLFHKDDSPGRTAPDFMKYRVIQGCVRTFDINQLGLLAHSAADVVRSGKNIERR